MFNHSISSLQFLIIMNNVEDQNINLQEIFYRIIALYDDQWD